MTKYQMVAAFIAHAAHDDFFDWHAGREKSLIGIAAFVMAISDGVLRWDPVRNCLIRCGTNEKVTIH